MNLVENKFGSCFGEPNILITFAFIIDKFDNNKSGAETIKNGRT